MHAPRVYRSFWYDVAAQRHIRPPHDPRPTHALTIHGPRTLELGYSRRVSGLPLSATETAPLEFSGEIMRGVKHAMFNGALDTVALLPRTFHLQTRDLRRRHNDDGSTSPFEVHEQTQP